MLRTPTHPEEVTSVPPTPFGDRDGASAEHDSRRDPHEVEESDHRS
jgi:hypothetical protein